MYNQSFKETWNNPQNIFPNPNLQCTTILANDWYSTTIPHKALLAYLKSLTEMVQ